MPLIENSLRPFWVPGLNRLSGKPEKPVRSWLTDGQYQLYSKIEEGSFVLNLPDENEFLAPLAADTNRFASAAFESVCQIEQSRKLPRSTAWLVIKSYYAAFFSAHAIFRMLGGGVLQMGANEARCITVLATAYGAASEHQVTKGLYAFAYDRNQRCISFHRLTSAKAGAHESFWQQFAGRMRVLRDEVLGSTTAPIVDNQEVSMKLDELCKNLVYAGLSNGAWLSEVRNDVNYRHGQGAWFPYVTPKALPRRLFDDRDLWRSDPMEIDMSGGAKGLLGRFQNTCNFLTGLCRAVVVDMARRHPRRASFHSYGSLALLNRVSY